MKMRFKKAVVLVLIISFVFSPVLATKAEAQWVVFDPAVFETTVSQQMKDQGLDGLAWMLVNLIIERMAASTVNWINSGFKGSPAYVTNPEAYFTDIGDKIAGQFIFNEPKLNFLCGPIQAKIRLALTRSYLREGVWQCTLTDAIGNMEDFMGDFDKGGWDKFFQLTQEQQNNPVGAYLQAESNMFEIIRSEQTAREKELDWGKGFLSYKKCSGQTLPGQDIIGPDGQPTGKKTEETCIGTQETVTPGEVISSQLNKQLGMGQDKLAVADEINEIVSALLNQLVNRVIGGIGKGLRGISGGGGSPSGDMPLTSQLSNSTDQTTKDYFGGSQNTTILDVPVPDPFCLDDPAFDTDPKTCANPRSTDPIWPDANVPLQVEVTNFPPPQPPAP